MHPPLPTEETRIDEFIASFEDGTLPKGRWTHAAHILTGACYVHRLGEAAALARMRERVCAYNLAVGGQNTASSGYHETVTVFWIKLLAGLRAQHPGLTRSGFAHHAVAALAPVENLLGRYYSYDVVGSSEARRIWRPPDLRPI